MRRLLVFSLVTFLLAVALHTHAHRTGGASFEVGSKEPPCPLCSQMGSTEVPRLDGVGIPAPLEQGVTIFAPQPALPARQGLAPLPARGPPGSAL